MAWVICSSDGSTSELHLFSNSTFNIFFTLWLSQKFWRIFSFHALHTCLHLWRLSRLSRPIINIILMKTSSGNMCQLMIACLYSVISHNMQRQLCNWSYSRLRLVFFHRNGSELYLPKILNWISWWLNPINEKDELFQSHYKNHVFEILHL